MWSRFTWLPQRCRARGSKYARWFRSIANFSGHHLMGASLLSLRSGNLPLLPSPLPPVALTAFPQYTYTLVPLFARHPSAAAAWARRALHAHLRLVVFSSCARSLSDGNAGADLRRLDRPSNALPCAHLQGSSTGAWRENTAQSGRGLHQVCYLRRS